MSQFTQNQIVRIREMLKKWRWRALAKAQSFSDRTTFSRPGISQTRRAISMPNMRDGGRSGCASADKVAPAGHAPFLVGEERRRFVIKGSYLGHPLFMALLKKTEEEVGFGRDGPLVLACEVDAFERILRVIKASSKAGRHGRSGREAEEEGAAEEEQYKRLLQQLLEPAGSLSSRSDSLTRPLCKAVVV